jgi:hypothetical protein
MGLDLVVEGCARPGHEAEWRRTLERTFEDEDLTEAEIARFQEISIPPYERLGAPRVGHDAAADAWIIQAKKVDAPEEVAALLKDFHGYHAVALVECDGVPRFTHAGLYEGVDETSFRGAFLEGCGDVLTEDQITEAWGHKLPEAAIAYGRVLLAAADQAQAAGPPPPRPPPKRGLLARLGLGGRKPADPMPFAEQLEIVRAAGRWFVFWGERGHPIRAWF